MVWSYPILSSDQRELFLRKSPLGREDNKDAPDLVYSQYQNNWYYIYTQRERSEKLPQVR